MLWLSNHSINPRTGRPEARYLWPFARFVAAVLWCFALAFLALAARAFAGFGATAIVAVTCGFSAIFVSVAIYHGRVLKRRQQALGAAVEAYEASMRRAFD